jgi:hypothetical protein
MVYSRYIMWTILSLITDPSTTQPRKPPITPPDKWVPNQADIISRNMAGADNYLTGRVRSMALYT